MHVEWSTLAFASECACGQLVEDCVTMVILNKAYRERGRERNWGAGLSLALHHLGILTLSSRIFTHRQFTCPQLCFPSQSCIYSLSVSCQITFTILFTNTSNKAQDVNVLLVLISATATELIIIIDLIGQTLLRRWRRLIWRQPRERHPSCQNSLHASWLSDTSLTKRELFKLNFFFQYAKKCCFGKGYQGF